MKEPKKSAQKDKLQERIEELEKEKDDLWKEWINRKKYYPAGLLDMLFELLLKIYSQKYKD